LLAVLLLAQGLSHYADWSAGGWQEALNTFDSVCHTLLSWAAHDLGSITNQLFIAVLLLAQVLSHYADWSAGGWHPKTFAAQDITPALLHNMRAGQQGSTLAGQTAACDAAAAARSASCVIFKSKIHADSVEHPDGTSSAAGRSSAGSAIAAAGQGWGRHEQLLAIDQQQSSLQDSQQQQQQQMGVAGGSSTSWLVEAGYVPLGYHCPLFGRKFTAAVVNQTLALALSCNGVGLGDWCRGSHGDV
jgi:hypothetical protein